MQRPFDRAIHEGSSFQFDEPVLATLNSASVPVTDLLHRKSSRHGKCVRHSTFVPSILPDSMLRGLEL